MIKMKLTKLTNLLVLGVVLTLGASGCRKHPTAVTPLPGQLTGTPKDLDNGKAIGTTGDKPVDSSATEGIASNDPSSHAGWTEDASIFKANTVHFAFDSAVVKDSDKANVTAIAEHLKANPNTAVRVEGHCDERGTAEYNRSLGERRAQAVRTELVGLGIPATSVDTLSYGFERPIEQGHDEAAWSKNRRGEFILLTRPTTAASAK
jgi:peptidoglycan-associated lipoprotein